MAKNFAAIAFSEEVKAMQEKAGKQDKLCKNGKASLPGWPDRK